MGMVNGSKPAALMSHFERGRHNLRHSQWVSVNPLAVFKIAKHRQWAAARFSRPAEPIVALNIGSKGRIKNSL